MTDTLSFTIVRTYAPNDKEFLGEEWNVELKRKGEVIMSGDYYHDKIDEEINGFFRGLEYLGFKYRKKVVKQNAIGLE